MRRMWTFFGIYVVLFGGWAQPLLSFDLLLASHPPPALNSTAAVNLTASDGVNVTGNGTTSFREGSLAEILDRVLEKEFNETTEKAGSEGSSFNSSVADQQAVLETVARVTKGNETEVHDESGAQDVPILIDSKDNVFVMMNSREGSMVLQSDLRFISDLVVLIVAAAIGGFCFALIGQPVITGYLLAGSAIGPGGLDLIRELVQVETLAQFGVIFLLFGLGMEFSLTKLRAVRAVAIFGGILQIVLFLCLCGITALICGGKVSEGVFVGALLSMSSTAVVLKCLMERSLMQALHAQVTMGTLILQDCTVGLLFALLPLLGNGGSVQHSLMTMAKSMAVLSLFVMAAVLIAHWAIAPLLQLLKRLSGQSQELYQLAAVALCLAIAVVSDHLGLSIELGAFVAGVMISTTDLAEHTLHQIDPIRNMFAALFLTSIGMIMNASFLWRHLDILLASVVLVVLAKTTLVAVVVRCFGYGIKTALTVGMSLAQIGEFAFVLLSRASNLHLVQRRLYLLLLGTTALSLVSTPLLFRLIPHIIQLGVGMRWVRIDEEAAKEQMVVKVENSSGGSVVTTTAYTHSWASSTSSASTATATGSSASANRRIFPEAADGCSIPSRG